MARKVKNFDSNSTFKVYIVAQKGVSDSGEDVYCITEPDTTYLHKNDGLAALASARAANPGNDDLCLYSFIVNPVVHAITLKATGIDADHAQERAARGVGIVTA